MGKFTKASACAAGARSVAARRRTAGGALDDTAAAPAPAAPPPPAAPPAPPARSGFAARTAAAAAGGGGGRAAPAAAARARSPPPPDADDPPSPAAPPPPAALPAPPAQSGFAARTAAAAAGGGGGRAAPAAAARARAGLDMKEIDDLIKKLGAAVRGKPPTPSDAKELDDFVLEEPGTWTPYIVTERRQLISSADVLKLGAIVFVGPPLLDSHPLILRYYDASTGDFGTMSNLEIDRLLYCIDGSRELYSANDVVYNVEVLLRVLRGRVVANELALRARTAATPPSPASAGAGDSDGRGAPADAGLDEQPDAAPPPSPPVDAMPPPPVDAPPPPDAPPPGNRRFEKIVLFVPDAARNFVARGVGSAARLIANTGSGRGARAIVGDTRHRLGHLDDDDDSIGDRTNVLVGDLAVDADLAAMESRDPGVWSMERVRAELAGDLAHDVPIGAGHVYLLVASARLVIVSALGNVALRPGSRVYLVVDVGRKGDGKAYTFKANAANSEAVAAIVKQCENQARLDIRSLVQLNHESVFAASVSPRELFSLHFFEVGAGRAPRGRGQIAAHERRLLQLCDEPRAAPYDPDAEPAPRPPVVPPPGASDFAERVRAIHADDDAVPKPAMLLSVIERAWNVCIAVTAVDGVEEPGKAELLLHRVMMYLAASGAQLELCDNMHAPELVRRVIEVLGDDEAMDLIVDESEYGRAHSAEILEAAENDNAQPNFTVTGCDVDNVRMLVELELSDKLDGDFIGRVITNAAAASAAAAAAGERVPAAVPISFVLAAYMMWPPRGPAVDKKSPSVRLGGPKQFLATSGGCAVELYALFIGRDRDDDMLCSHALLRAALEAAVRTMDSAGTDAGRRQVASFCGPGGPGPMREWDFDSALVRCGGKAVYAPRLDLFLAVLAAVLLREGHAVKLTLATHGGKPVTGENVDADAALVDMFDTSLALSAHHFISQGLGAPAFAHLLMLREQMQVLAGFVAAGRDEVALDVAIADSKAADQYISAYVGIGVAATSTNGDVLLAALGYQQG